MMSLNIAFLLINHNFSLKIWSPQKQRAHITMNQIFLSLTWHNFCNPKLMNVPNLLQNFVNQKRNWKEGKKFLMKLLNQNINIYTAYYLEKIKLIFVNELSKWLFKEDWCPKNFLSWFAPPWKWPLVTIGL